MAKGNRQNDNMQKAEEKRQKANDKMPTARDKCKRQEASSLEVRALRGVYCELLTVGGGKFTGK